MSPIRSAWPSTVYLGPLTDKKIEAYKKRGFYSEEYRTARRELWKKKRKGNFDEVDGRLIYRPS